jgi:hypothetical protein
MATRSVLTVESGVMMLEVLVLILELNDPIHTLDVDGCRVVSSSHDASKPGKSWDKLPNHTQTKSSEYL